jgi:hypothetical protein
MIIIAIIIANLIRITTSILNSQQIIRIRILFQNKIMMNKISKKLKKVKIVRKEEKCF